MKRVIVVGKIKKGQLVKCKIEEGKLREMFAAISQCMEEMQARLVIGMDISGYPAGDNHVPGSHS